MSLIRTARSQGRSLLLAAVLVALSAGVASAQEPTDPNPGNLTISGAIDVLNAYMFRGIRQEAEEELVLWPYVDLGISMYSGEGGLKSASLNFGTWNSLHTGSSGTDGASGKLWYESDFYATLGLGFGGGVSLGTTYTAYTSANNSFTTVKEIAFKLAIDDSAKMGKGAFKPYVLIAQELAAAPGRGQADGGANAGTYVEIGVSPGWAATAASLAFPVKIGLSAGDYYEGPDGDETFGYLSVAGIVTIPITGVSANFGSWNLHGGVEFQKLGSSMEVFNLGESTKVIATVGLGFAY